MHSKIIQLNKTPIDRENWSTESDFYDGFAGWIADYVADVDDDVRNMVISDFKEGFDMSYRDFVTIEDDHIIFKNGFKDEYAGKILECLKEFVKEATVNSVRNGSLRYGSEELLGDPFGIYIATEYGLVRENVWLTEYIEEDTPYYFGGVVDYHY